MGKKEFSLNLKQTLCLWS